MSKFQNIKRENKRMQGNMNPKKINNYTIEDLVDSEEDESSDAKVKRIIIRMFTELKKNIQKQLYVSQENMYKELKKTQKQLNKLKEDSTNTEVK
jgi:hypothetical protein